MIFLRKVKIASGTTAIQLARKVYSRETWIEHTGIAHNEAKLIILLTQLRNGWPKINSHLFRKINHAFMFAVFR